MGESFMQKAAEGSACKLWHHSSQSAISQTMKIQGRSLLQYNDMRDLILISKKFFLIFLI